MKEKVRRIKMPKPHRIHHPAAPALEWLSDVSGHAVRATSIGNRRILIENHTGILSFTDEEVRLSSAMGALCVRGRALSLCEVRETALIVHGCIHDVELPEEGGAK